MRPPFFLALFLVCASQLPAQTPANTEPGLPKDPSAIFAAAGPLYDFTSPELKPWHLKATYQLYDDNGKPSEKGTFEFWWASPNVHRTSWARPGASQSEWYTADGKQRYLTSGAPLSYFEHKLESALLAPLPGEADLDPARFHLQSKSEKAGDLKLSCVMVVPLGPESWRLKDSPLGLFPTYCFSLQGPVVRVEYSLGALAMGFNRILKVQGRYLAGDIVFFDADKKILTAAVEEATSLSPSDPALAPPADTAQVNLEKANLSSAVAGGMLIKKQFPVYPQDAKSARVSGRVILQATIGKDGGIHELRVVSAPWPSLAASALWSVSHWQYKPYRLNGEPVEVKTTINVIFDLRG